jgi:hypothetical protein
VRIASKGDDGGEGGTSRINRERMSPRGMFDENAVLRPA